MTIAIVIAGILGLLVFGVLSLIMWESRSRMSGGVVSSTPSDESSMFRKGLPWVVGVALIIILSMNVGNLPGPKGLNIDFGFWIALLAIMGLAVASVFFKKGGVAGSFAVWFMIGGLVMLLIFGDNMSKVRSAIKDGATSAILDDNPQTKKKSAVVRDKMKWLGHENDQALSVGVWSPFIKVPGGLCVWIYHVVPNQVMVKDRETDEGQLWEAYHANGKRPIGWFSVRGDSKMTVVRYVFRKYGECS